MDLLLFLASRLLAVQRCVNMQLSDMLKRSVEESCRGWRSGATCLYNENITLGSSLWSHLLCHKLLAVRIQIQAALARSNGCNHGGINGAAQGGEIDLHR